MKRSERRHLKQNEVANWVTRTAAAYSRRRGAFLTVGAVVLAGLVGWGGLSTWQDRSNAEASVILANAVTIMNAPVVPPVAPLVNDPLDEETSETAPADDEVPTSGLPPLPPLPPPPGSYPSERAKREAALVKFMEAADTQPNGEVGLSARYYAAAILAELERTDEAAEQYRTVREGTRAGIYGDMARLGLAEIDTIRGDYDAAIATWVDVSTAPVTHVPADGALMRLGQVYAMAGRGSDAVASFTRLVDEYPESQYVPSAQQEIEALEEDVPTAGSVEP